jgi:hypothetical protein
VLLATQGCHCGCARTQVDKHVAVECLRDVSALCLEVVLLGGTVPVEWDAQTLMLPACCNARIEWPLHNPVLYGECRQPPLFRTVIVGIGVRSPLDTVNVLTPARLDCVLHHPASQTRKQSRGSCLCCCRDLTSRSRSSM